MRHEEEKHEKEKRMSRTEAPDYDAMDMNWSTRYDVDGDLRWDANREVWVGSDGFAFDGAGLQDYSRGGGITDA